MAAERERAVDGGQPRVKGGEMLQRSLARVREHLRRQREAVNERAARQPPAHLPAAGTRVCGPRAETRLCS